MSEKRHHPAPAICQGEVTKRKEVTERHTLLWLRAPEVALGAGPGKFVHVKVREGPTPLLRRPFSIAMAEGEEIALLIERRGLGSSLLFNVKGGQKVNLLGPLGRGFSVEVNGSSRLLVGGGVGVAPLLFLARRLAEKGKRFKFIVGARTKTLLPLPEELCGGLPVEVATEDGSLGFRGTVIDALKEALSKGTDSIVPFVFVQACGPLGMLKTLDKLRQRKGFEGEASVEARMGCGIGACLGCAVPVKVRGEGGLVKYVRACTEGPVFPLGEVDLSLLPAP